MTRTSKIFLIIALSFLAPACEDERKQDNLALFTGTSGLVGSADLTVVSSSPYQSETVSAGQTVRLVFSRPIHTGRCSSAFTLDDATSGTFTVGLNVLDFDPSSNLSVGSHTIDLTTDCEDLEGKDLLAPFSISFTVGSTSVPAVQAVGLASQGCSSVYPGTGSAGGGDHTLGACWWDASLSKLSPTFYEFRGGDDGTGVAASTNACGDVNTDNFRLIFSEYMDIGTTTAAISLTRLSGPTTLIKLASHVWSDCDSVAPYGCRVVTLSFAEAEATCNGTTNFGNGTTNGDFNLAQTNAPQVADFPLYRIEVATTARSTDGTTLPASFTFDMEGN